VTVVLLAAVFLMAAVAPHPGATLPGGDGDIAYGVIDEIDSSEGISFEGQCFARPSRDDAGMRRFAAG